MALDVHAEDIGSVGADLVGVVGELDAPGLAPPADLHLGLDYDRVAHPVGLSHRLVDRVRHAAGRHGDPEAGKVLLALVLEQIHTTTIAISLVNPGATTSRGQRACACADAARY